MPDKPKTALRRGISLRPRRYVELTCPRPLPEALASLKTALPGITTEADGSDVIRFSYFVSGDPHEAARASGYLKALADGTTLVSATARVVPGWLWLLIKKQLHFDHQRLFNLTFSLIVVGVLSLCTFMFATSTVSSEDITMAWQMRFTVLPFFLFGCVVAGSMLLDYVLLTRYRDDIVTALEDAFPLQPDKPGKID